jgi:hypothetical protein
MNSTIPSTYQSGATSANIPPELMKKDWVSFGPSRSPSRTWQKFIHSSAQQSDSQIDAIASAKGTAIERIIAIEPMITLEELLSGPLFQVAGIFEIDEPAWAERHDELLGEAYR